MSKSNHYPQFPLYIPSKGRYEYMMTSKSLTEMGVSHNIVVEPQEVENYQKAVKHWRLLTKVIPLDMSFKEKYELCDDLGLAKSTGSGPARNFCWEHSLSEGHDWHWIMDDNIRHFCRLNKNERVNVKTSAFWRAMEDFVLRYKNVAMAGPHYRMFAPDRQKQPPFITNTRVYSCNLIRNDLPYRWRGRYNEDTILSLDMLKGGWCTIQFKAFLQDKMPTQTIKGGNTDELYQGDTRSDGERYAKQGTVEKSQMLVREHPDVASVVWRFGRIHHHVDYSCFKQKLLRKENIHIPKDVNDYGMSLRKTK